MLSKVRLLLIALFITSCTLSILFGSLRFIACNDFLTSSGLFSDILEFSNLICHDHPCDLFKDFWGSGREVIWAFKFRYELCSFGFAVSYTSIVLFCISTFEYSLLCAALWLMRELWLSLLLDCRSNFLEVLWLWLPNLSKDFLALILGIESEFFIDVLNSCGT